MAKDTKFYESYYKGNLALCTKVKTFDQTITSGEKKGQVVKKELYIMDLNKQEFTLFESDDFKVKEGQFCYPELYVYQKAVNGKNGPKIVSKLGINWLLHLEG